MRRLLLAFLLVPSLGQAQLTETRYCTTTPVRELDGTIKRSQEAITAFRRTHPCPITNKTTGACSGWAVDHVVPLACGGCDAVSNMQWLPNGIKSAAGTLPKDRWERRVYCKGSSQ